LAASLEKSKTLVAIDALQARLARELKRSIAEEVAAPLRVSPLPPYPVPYREFGLGLSNPTFLVVFAAREFGGEMCLEISPQLAYLLIEQMLGGGGAEPLVPQRPFTRVEARLIERVAQRVLDCLGIAWGLDPPIQLYLKQLVADPSEVHLVPPEETVTAAPLEIYAGRHSGRLTVCLTASAVERIPVGGDEEAAGNQPVVLAALLAETTLKLADLLTLQPDDIITTELPADGDVTLLVGDRPAFLGQLVKFRGKRAVAITRRV
jgi:flagellar motor switch protein FliM